MALFPVMDGALYSRSTRLTNMLKVESHVVINGNINLIGAAIDNRLDGNTENNHNNTITHYFAYL